MTGTPLAGDSNDKLLTEDRLVESQFLEAISRIARKISVVRIVRCRAACSSITLEQSNDLHARITNSSAMSVCSKLTHAPQYLLLGLSLRLYLSSTSCLCSSYLGPSLRRH